MEDWSLGFNKALSLVYFHPLYFYSEGIFRTGIVCGGTSGISVFYPRLHSIKEMIFGYFPQPLSQTQFLILKILNVFRRLKSSSSLTYLKLSHFSMDTSLKGE